MEETVIPNALSPTVAAGGGLGHGILCHEHLLKWIYQLLVAVVWPFWSAELKFTSSSGLFSLVLCLYMNADMSTDVHSQTSKQTGQHGLTTLLRGVFCKLRWMSVSGSFYRKASLKCRRRWRCSQQSRRHTGWIWFFPLEVNTIILLKSSWHFGISTLLW